MKRLLGNFLWMSMLCSVLCWSCKDDESETGSSDNKPVIENAVVSPSSSVAFGDVIHLTGTLSDKTGLRSYTVKFSNAAGDIWETTNMLTGTSYNLNLDLVLPLPKNVTAGDVKISLTLKNTDNGSNTEELTLTGVTIPVFDNLYLVIGNKVCTMEKAADGVFVYNDLISANATGKIYANADKSGLYWGQTSGVIASLADGDLTVGGADETYMEVRFNPITFEFSAAQSDEVWTESQADPIYILGNISGHWADGDITTENAKMKMTEFVSGSKKYWTWTPPATGSGDPVDDMWGNINPGSFRFKLGGQEQYIIYQNNTIETGTGNDASASFITSAGGPLTIKLFYDGTAYTKVSLESETKMLEFLANGAININGAPSPAAIVFAGSNLAKKSGSLYVYEGTVNLTKDQTFTATGTDLTTAEPDPDAFSGKGNATWTVVGTSGAYTIRIDPFASTIYACKQSGYPDVIYMDGWSWAKFESATTVVWNPEAYLCLYRKDAGKQVYEAVFYNNGWSGDVKFFSKHLATPDYGKYIINQKYFDNVEAAGDGLKIPSAAGYYKVTVDLKDGFTYNMEALDGEYFALVQATAGQKYTVTFTAQ
ncbi:MAG: DUF4625 domain-containing protein [Dysgonamonadaceae bacterium]|jgi:hypothetical protein|nr:DUF4625 domain-containing protein [Dysgonamonadaceae bacterium]